MAVTWTAEAGDTLGRSLDGVLSRSLELPVRLAGLVDSAAAPADISQRWRVGLETALGGVERSWAAHVLADEDPDSFLTDVAAHVPLLFRALDDQRLEHSLLEDALAGARCAAAAAVDEVGVATARYAVARVSRDIERHLRDGECAAWEIAKRSST